jgi:hypothetical protein
MPARLNQEEIIRFFRLKGLNPIEDYQGVRTPCNCECLVCGKVVSPTLASLRAGRGGCAYCAGTKVDPKDAEALLISRGLQPLVSYPGSKIPWKCIHLKCNQIVFPTFNKIQQGQSGCISCSGLSKKTNDEATSFFKSKGLIPLEPYQNSATKWKSKHTECGNIVFPRYRDVQQGHSGCIHCASRVSDTVARELFLRVGLNPLIEFPGSVTAWPSIHKECGRLVSPMYSNIQQGKGPCDYCGGSKPIDPTEALELFRSNNFEPQEEFKNANSPWKSVHEICGGVVHPSYSRIASGGGCRVCLEKSRVQPEIAEQVFIQKRIKPIVAFPGAGKPWLSIHLECGREISPTFTSINNGGGCRYCAVSGFKLDEPGVVYLITSAELQAHKIGITGVHTKRLQDHSNLGWKIYSTLEIFKGEIALQIEQDVLQWIRYERELPIYLSPEQMPQGGWTETVEASEIDLPTIWAKVEELSKVKK